MEEQKATQEEIAEVTAMLADAANDPNLVIGGPTCEQVMTPVEALDILIPQVVASGCLDEIKANASFTSALFDEVAMDAAGNRDMLMQEKLFMTNGRIVNLEMIHDLLVEQFGYSIQEAECGIVVDMGQSIPALIMIDDVVNELIITCRLAKFGEIKEENLTSFAVASLDLNTRIRPFAMAIITDADDANAGDEEDWDIVLTDSISMSDLSLAELNAAMDNLMQAILSSRDVIALGVN